MAMVVNNDPEMEKTIDMLSMLSETELTAVNAVIRAIVSRNQANDPFAPLNEQQPFEKIDAALKQADEGLYKDSYEFEKELIAQFGA